MNYFSCNNNGNSKEVTYYYLKMLTFALFLYYSFFSYLNWRVIGPKCSGELAIHIYGKNTIQSQLIKQNKHWFMNMN